MWWIIVLILSSCALFPVGFCVGFCAGAFVIRWWMMRNSRDYEYERYRGLSDEEKGARYDSDTERKKRKKKKKNKGII